jgi:hypothetical protein
MDLQGQLKEIAKNHDSLFRRQLAKEDLARFERLREMALASETLEAFIKDGLYAGWTQNDMRTHELKETILPVLEAFYGLVRGTQGEETALKTAWSAFEVDRLNKLIHCL